MKRVLLVDDELPMLDALRTQLQRMADRWDMHFVESGERAIEELERGVFDVVVTDMRMPRMDGAELLRIVSERWPDVIRIVLSGHPESEQTLRLVPYAHQYLSKPCEPKQLEAVIDRCLRLHQLLRQQNLRAVVGRIKKLPAMPRVYTQLRAALATDTVTTGDVARIVAADAVVAAKVLHLVNSAFFRLARRITNIEQAVTYLGFVAIRNLTLSVEVFSSWPEGGAATKLNVERLHSHVHLVAGAARALAGAGVTADDALLAGLLHDIGYWVLAQECAPELERSIETAAQLGIPLHQAERQVIGASHAEIGAYLLGIWGLPYPVIDAVAHHHTPYSVKASEYDLLAALATAHSLVPADDSAAFETKLVSDPKVDAEYLLATNAPFSWTEATRRVRESLETEDPRP
jgi:putative nucleotidyltransferase with HDIG domain